MVSTTSIAIILLIGGRFADLECSIVKVNRAVRFAPATPGGSNLDMRGFAGGIAESQNLNGPPRDNARR